MGGIIVGKWRMGSFCRREVRRQKSGFRVEDSGEKHPGNTPPTG
jgi:hypothetical protein